jgi:hypothetical protein
MTCSISSGQQALAWIKWTQINTIQYNFTFCWQKSSLSENWASSCSRGSSASSESSMRYVVYKQPLSLDRFFIHDVTIPESASCRLEAAFVLVSLNRFQQVVTIHTFQAPSDQSKVCPNRTQHSHYLTLNIPSLARQRCLSSWGPRRTPWFFCNFSTVWCGRLFKLCFLGFWSYNSVIQALLASNILCLFISTEVSQ